MDLLETMRVEAGGAVPLLHRHLARLANSAQNLGFLCHSAELRAAIEREAIKQKTTVVFRLLLARDGSHQLQVKPLPTAQITRLVLAPAPVSSTDPALRHKTTSRAVYDAARAGLPPDTDAILINERGEATETTIANIAVLRDGLWITPPLSSGLLPGVMRAALLDEGRIVERAIPADQLESGESVRYFNSVRGVLDVRFAGGS